MVLEVYEAFLFKIFWRCKAQSIPCWISILLGHTLLVLETFNFSFCFSLPLPEILDFLSDATSHWKHHCCWVWGSKQALNKDPIGQLKIHADYWSLIWIILPDQEMFHNFYGHLRSQSLPFVRSCFIIQFSDSITLWTTKTSLTFDHSPTFSTDKVLWSSLSWVSCDDVNCAVQLRPADGNTPYMYYFYSHYEEQLHRSPWKLYGWVMVMTLKERHGLQRGPGMQRGDSEVYSSLLMVTITVAAGCELGAMLYCQSRGTDATWTFVLTPGKQPYTISIVKAAGSPPLSLRVSHCCWHLYGIRWDLFCHGTWTQSRNPGDSLMFPPGQRGAYPWFLSYLQHKWAVPLVNSSALFKSLQLGFFLLCQGINRVKLFLPLHFCCTYLWWCPQRSRQRQPQPGSRWHQCTAVTVCTKTVIRKKKKCHCSCCLQPFCLILAQKHLF